MCAFCATLTCSWVTADFHSGLLHPAKLTTACRPTREHALGRWSARADQRREGQRRVDRSGKCADLNVIGWLALSMLSFAYVRFEPREGESDAPGVATGPRFSRHLLTCANHGREIGGSPTRKKPVVAGG